MCRVLGHVLGVVPLCVIGHVLGVVPLCLQGAGPRQSAATPPRGDHHGPCGSREDEPAGRSEEESAGGAGGRGHHAAHRGLPR